MILPTAEDCSYLHPQPDAEMAIWFRELARDVQAKNHVLTMGNNRGEDEPIVFCDWEGRWRTGRYIGSVCYKGRTLTIRPRLGISTLRDWLDRANNLFVIEAPGDLKEDTAFLAELLARVWAQSFANAARHGPPALRADHIHSGDTIRGRIDVASTVAKGRMVSRQIVSVRRERTLDNPIVRAIACAYLVLRRWIGTGREHTWLPQRCQELLPQVLAAVGSRPQLPSEVELARIRYTPITESYRRFVRLSWQIARQRGIFGDSNLEGQSKGVLLDVAELWELYVLAIAREAAHPLVVSHGTHETAGREFLLRSEVDETSMAELRPDAVLFDGAHPRCVLDAKYKFLSDWPPPVREDVYQMGAYMMSFGLAHSHWGALIYPQDDKHPELTSIELRNPWKLTSGSKVSFLRLSHNGPEALVALREILATQVP